jgi:integrase
LFDRLNLKPSTIEGYRSMLSPLLRARGIDLSNDRTTSDLLASFRTQRPRVLPNFPEWDMAFVLYCLTKAPWEPLSEISIKRLTLKTFFLVLLASGRRRSDVGAIDISRIAFKRNQSVTLFPAREFVPKTKAAKEGGKAFSPIVLPSLQNAVGEGEPDSLLCPVRALNTYIRRTQSFRNKRNKLFLSYQRERRSDISCATLSLWVKMVVRLAYSESGASDQMLYKVTAHQLRHVSMSLASKANVPLEVLVQAGMWTNPTTFHAFYLGDASETLAQTGRFRLGPLVAAQSII